MTKPYIPFSKKDLKEIAGSLGPEAIKELKYRRTGRSLGIALQTIGRALQNPNEEIKVIDHFERGNRFLFDLIFDQIEKLDLIGFVGNKQRLSIMFQLDTSAIDEILNEKI